MIEHATWPERLETVGRALAAQAEEKAFTVVRPHDYALLLRQADATVAVLPGGVDPSHGLFAPIWERVASARATALVVGPPRDEYLTGTYARGVFSVLREGATEIELAHMAGQAFAHVALQLQSERRGVYVDRYRQELSELVDIARIMTTERDVDTLLSLILSKSRRIVSADAGSIYVVEDDQLRFKLSQNDSVSFDSREFTMPISNRSIAGTVALTRKTILIDDVYDLPQGTSYAFDRTFDDRVGYATKSMLVAPLVSQRREVIGVIQLINRKANPDRALLCRQDVREGVIPFDTRCAELLGMVGAQAGASLETALLYDEIRRVFEGFVRASVDAIEARDPTTSGHSRRVAQLTLRLAQIVSRTNRGAYADVRFSADELRELEYASVLHDFGKIGVREPVLVKAKKLYPDRLDLISTRLDLAERTFEAEILARKVELLEQGAPREQLDRLNAEFEARVRWLEEARQTIARANEPTVMTAGSFSHLEAIARDTYLTPRGEVVRILDEVDVGALSVRQGSLTPREIEEIRSHVTHTQRFLSKIPWGKALRRIPDIAAAHHERLDGTGYPRRLRAEEIPIQSKMMAIADIFDALTAADRPYKRAVPVEKALDILRHNVDEGHLDGELCSIFAESRPWETIVAAPQSWIPPALSTHP